MKFKNFITDAISYAKATSDDITSRLDEIDGEFYATAEEEIDNGEIDRGLWSKAFVQAKGEENLRKAIYIELRAKQLKIKEVESRKSDKEMKKMLSALSPEIKKNIEAKKIKSIDRYNSNGYTPLMTAVNHMHVETVIDLLAKGANPKIVDENHGTSTALDMAFRLLKIAKTTERRSGYRKIIHLLQAALSGFAGN